MLLTVFIILLLAIITYQDFKYRAISWFLIPATLVFFIIKGLTEVAPREYIYYIVVNFIFLLLNLIGTTVIISIKEKRLVNLIDNYIGLGDILFFIVLTTVFSPINFLTFYIGSILIGIISYFILKSLYKNSNDYYPLAGAMSSLLIVSLVSQELILNIHFFNDIIF